MILVVVLFPVALLALVLGMSMLEDGLDAVMQRADSRDARRRQDSTDRAAEPGSPPRPGRRFSWLRPAAAER